MQVAKNGVSASSNLLQKNDPKLVQLLNKFSTYLSLVEPHKTFTVNVNPDEVIAALAKVGSSPTLPGIGYKVSFEAWEALGGMGYRFAAYNVATGFKEGRGVTANEERAQYWFDQAYKNADPHACREKGHAYCYGLADQYSDVTGVDYAKAMECYLKGANQTADNNENLQHSIANCHMQIAQLYQHGQGIEKNEQMALHWYRSALNVAPKYWRAEQIANREIGRLTK